VSVNDGHSVSIITPEVVHIVVNEENTRGCDTAP
jgi:hypothetical protein